MSDPISHTVVGESQLRSRTAAQSKPDGQVEAKSDESAQEKVMRLNQEQARIQDDKARKTFGRTPNGTIFTVPETHDMVSQLLSPSRPKNASDLIVLLILGLHISMLYVLPKSFQIPVIGIVYLFWRMAYNAGIGYLLQVQSGDRRLVYWAQRSGIFEKPESGKNPYPQVHKFLKREFETIIPNDYKMQDAPIEYNTWLLFRRVVDLILMCDFVSYCLFAVACASQPPTEGILWTIGRWLGGIALFLFNLWVKLDAHRVVKDYAWYWGDFFFLVDQELTFDGVFEMAPHPMYSVGYAGYYGISLMAASYKVLAISIVAHAAQMAFLILVENPHIEKTYNPPPKRASPSATAQRRESHGSETVSESEIYHDQPSDQPSAVHRILGLQNTDMHRVVDVAVILLQVHMFLLASFTPSTPLSQFLFVVNAIVWRLWYTLGIGFILNRQSNKKAWTRHFIKFGDDKDEAWRQWKGIYHISMHMCYASFIACAWKMYHLPADWSYGSALFRHVIGSALIALHIWTAASIYESLDEFGWFYGDFFYDHASKLNYDGIYRFLNNPERFLGLAGLWGFAIITWSRAIFAIALVSHLLSLSFIQFVERPHMQKLYGESLRRQSGLSKGIRRVLPKSVAQIQTTVDQRIEQTADFIDDLIEAAKPKFAASVEYIVRDATSLFRNYPPRINLTRTVEDVAKYNRKDYSLSVSGTRASALAELESRSGREGEGARQPPERTGPYKSLMFEFGSPLKVKWTAPVNHGKKDWIGLYMVSDIPDRQITRTSSRGRWVATNRNEYDSVRADQGILTSNVLVASSDATTKSGKQLCEGEMVFEGDKLWWTTGVFEFRYHHDGGHNVMTISAPFEIRIGKFDEDDVELDASGTLRTAVSQALLPVVRNCFDHDPDIAPHTIDEAFGSLVERDGKFAKRVVFAVHQMFGIEFAPEVVQADGSVKNLAWRICNAKKALAPYSLSSASSGRATPGSNKY